MDHSTAGGRALSIAAGVVFASGTLAILFEDVIRHSAQFTLKHYLTLVTLTGTMMAGHLFKKAWAARQLGAIAGFGLLFVSGTCLVVYSSLGRQASVSMQTEAEVDDLADQRARIRPQLERAERMLAEAQSDLGKECKTGRGKRCEGIQATISVYLAAVEGHKAALAKLGPPKAAAPEIEQVGIYADALGYDKAKAKVLASLALPLFLALFLEYGTIASFGYGFRPARKVAAKPVPTVAKTFSAPVPVENEVEIPELFALPARKRPATDEEMVRAALDKAGRKVNVSELATLLGRSTGEASKMVSGLNGKVQKMKHGREVLISMPALN